MTSRRHEPTASSLFAVQEFLQSACDTQYVNHVSSVFKQVAEVNFGKLRHAHLHMPPHWQALIRTREKMATQVLLVSFYVPKDVTAQYL